jgi:hypothetical protein
LPPFESTIGPYLLFRFDLIPITVVSQSNDHLLISNPGLLRSCRRHGNQCGSNSTPVLRDADPNPLFARLSDLRDFP